MYNKCIGGLVINAVIIYMAYKINSILGAWGFIFSFLSGAALMLLNIRVFGTVNKTSIPTSEINKDIQYEVIQKVREIEKENKNLAVVSKIDSMTGLYLKWVIEKNIESRIEKEPNSQFSILMFDIDKFKGINDTLGHQIGDKCIKILANFAQASFRRGDILGRYGGDEFIIILPETNSQQAFIIADRFRQIIQNKSNPRFTISMGIATYPDNADSLTGLIEAADKALYISKQNGRNRVTCL